MCYVVLAPNPPVNVSATTLSSTTVQVSWDPPVVTNGMIRYYTVTYGRNDSSDRTMEPNSTNTSIVVTGLNPFTYYVFYVVAVTVASSNDSESDIALTDQAGNNT